MMLKSKHKDQYTCAGIAAIAFVVSIPLGILLVMFLFSNPFASRQEIPGKVHSTQLVRELRLGNAEKEDFSEILFTRNNRRIFIGGDKIIVEVDPETLLKRSTIDLSESMIFDIAVSPDSRNLALADYSGYIRILSTDPLRLTKSIKVNGWPTYVVFSENGSHVYYTCPMQNILGRILLDGSQPPKSVYLKGEPAGIAVNGSRLFVGYYQNPYVTEHNIDMHQIHKITLPTSRIVKKPSEVGSLDFGPSEVISKGKYLFIYAPMDGKLWRVDLNTHETREINTGYGTSGLRFLKNGRLVSLGDGWKVSDGSPTTLISTEPFQISRIFQTHSLGENVHLRGPSAFDPKADGFYVIYSNGSDILLQQRTLDYNND